MQTYRTTTHIYLVSPFLYLWPVLRNLSFKYMRIYFRTKKPQTISFLKPHKDRMVFTTGFVSDLNHLADVLTGPDSELLEKNRLTAVK